MPVNARAAGTPAAQCACAIGWLVVCALALTSFPVFAQNCGWSHVDHRVSYDASGIWNPDIYRGLVGLLTAGEIGGAVWEGAQTRFGKTMWQGIDSEIIGSVAATAGKYIFTRTRPSSVDNPCLWFQGGSNYRFRAARQPLQPRW